MAFLISNTFQNPYEPCKHCQERLLTPNVMVQAVIASPGHFFQPCVWLMMGQNKVGRACWQETGTKRNSKITSCQQGASVVNNGNLLQCLLYSRGHQLLAPATTQPGPKACWNIAFTFKVICSFDKAPMSVVRFADFVVCQFHLPHCSSRTEQHYLK